MKPEIGWKEELRKAQEETAIIEALARDAYHRERAAQDAVIGIGKLDPLEMNDGQIGMVLDACTRFKRSASACM